MSGWYEASKTGLEKVARRRGLSFVLLELIQNGLDTRAGTVKVTLEPVPDAQRVWVRVEDDDPDGFKDMTHAWTLFAESEKKGDPTKRGRFNLGEKLVLAVCESAEVISTKSSVRFDSDGRHIGRKRREKGTLFEGLIKMTRAEMDEVRQAARLIIPPAACEVFIDGEKLPSRTPLASFEVTLPTEIADSEGFLKRSARKTTVNVFALLSPVSRIYELGIPVVETELPWDVEITQKIPLNSDRDNVTPAYLREVSVAVVNHMHKFLKPEDAVLPAVQEALGDSRISVEAVTTIVTHQHGEKRVTLDPRNPESNAKAFQEGFTVIGGGAHTKEQWANIRRAGAQSASTLFPVANPYDPNGDPTLQIPESDWSPGMQNMASYSKALAKHVLGKDIHVRFEKRVDAIDVANYGRQNLCFNVGRLGFKWFDQGINVAVNDLLIHELAHEYGQHLTKEFDDGLSLIGAKMVELAMVEPEFFLKYLFGRTR